MPVPAMVEPDVDHQRRFQAAVDVIHNLPKNGCYRPSYEVMLRFYSLYKQAVCGPCTGSRPGFWDPVGRYKWDAWSRLGDMSTESAMAAYVDEMKKVAQEVIDTMPMDEKTASLFHHFEPLYLVIDDMPRPPEALLSLRDGPKGVDDPVGAPDLQEEEEEEESSPPEGPPGPTGPAVDQKSQSEEGLVSENPLPNDSSVSEGLLLTSDSENEIFCDSVDSVEQLGHIKAPVLKSNGVQNGHVSPIQSHVKQVGAGQGGEGAEDGKGPTRRSRDGGRETSHGWRERGVPQGSPRRGGPGGGGAGRGGGGDGSEGGAERLHDGQLQQQIVLALQRLREDMRSVMERLEAVERLAAAHGSDRRTCVQCSQQQEVKWWPLDVSTPTALLFLLWPFVAQGLLYLLRKGQRRRRSDISS